MLDNIKNYMMIRSDETIEEHLGKVLELDRNTKKIKLQLIDDNKNLFYRRDKEIEVVIPKESDLFCFKSFVIFYDVLERTIIVQYPEELNKVIKRGHKRYDINIPIDICTDQHCLPSISFDLGLGGIGILVNPQFALEEEIQIKIKDQNLANEVFKVRVLNKKEFKYKGKDYILYGGEFINLKKEAFEKLMLFLNRRNNQILESASSN